MHDLASIRDSWDQAARQDAMWNIITDARYANGGWDPDEFFAHGKREIDAAMDRLDSLGLPRGGPRALDFGCGIGRLSVALADYYDEVFGVDLSEEMVFRAAVHERVTYGCEESLSRFTESQYDLVYSMIVLQHMPHDYQRGYVKEFFRVLKPGGIAMFQIPAGPVVGHPGNHLSMYGVDRETVEGWIQSGGGELVDVEDLGCEADWTSYRYTAIRSQ